MEDDLAAYRQAPSSNPEHLYRVGELSDALRSPAYQRFLELLPQAPVAERAFIYYEVSGANGIWSFAPAVDGDTCRIVAVDYDGEYEWTCRGFSSFEPSVEDARFAFRDPLVAGLVQYEPGRTPIRSMALIGPNEAAAMPPDDDFVGEVRRIFSQQDTP